MLAAVTILTTAWVPSATAGASEQAPAAAAVAAETAKSTKSTKSTETAGLSRTGQGCDPIDPVACLLPFPNDWFTVADRRTATGRRVRMSAAMTPRNVLGVPIDPAEWNRTDGFSPGSMLLTHVPRLDLARTGAAPVTNIGRSLRADRRSPSDQHRCRAGVQRQQPGQDHGRRVHGCSWPCPRTPGAACSACPA